MGARGKYKKRDPDECLEVPCKDRATVFLTSTGTATRRGRCQLHYERMLRTPASNFGIPESRGVPVHVKPPGTSKRAAYEQGAD